MGNPQWNLLLVYYGEPAAGAQAASDPSFKPQMDVACAEVRGGDSLGWVDDGFMRGCEYH